MTIPVARYYPETGWLWRGQRFADLRSKRLAEARTMIAEYAKDAYPLMHARYEAALVAIEAEAARRGA